MRTYRKIGLALAAACAIGASATLVASEKAPASPPAGTKTAPGDIEVKLCDDHTTTRVPAGTALTPTTGQQIADALMAKWKAENPSADWEAEERKSRTFLPAADNRHLLAPDTQAAGHPYRQWKEVDLLEWKRETERLVVAGSKVFHSADELGSTIAVSCDMCHPNAANTHPETYPKYQTQIGRAVLLRDMINWCLEHPCRAPKMDADDPRMRAMEAYIVSQRAGTKLEYGKH